MLVSTITNFVTDKRIYLDYFCKRSNILKKRLSTLGHTETNTLGERFPDFLGLVDKMYSEIHSS
ncbi:hypothetical protein EZJ55_23225 [Microcystis aeruginosa EAWAG127a]|uniref:Uncharacterized protein n=1 Tax=Microcystis aeruginosa EAWAG127a TaxID=2529855 RepID=A0A5J5LZE6_MICAE|nr:hypothetical protein EZJ55_23225 [Microcystis aeruginosa EAWAG127a]